MNILIVDDNKNNRLILSLLLQDYQEEHSNVEFNLTEAADGKEAVKMCKEKNFDLVLMDIMMPNMDGIEATKIIRSSDKKIMIIAVSAVDDMERQKLILSNGAQDYISKPVNADIFNTRITNYVSLIEARQHEKMNKNCINLFNQKIFSRHTKFIITSEDSLSEFWEHFLLNIEDKCENLSDVVRAIFSIAEIQLKLEIKTEIYVEDSEECRYLTLMRVDEIPEKIVTLTLKKNNVKSTYKIADGKISFSLDKNTRTISTESTEIVTSKEKEIVKIQPEVPLEIAPIGTYESSKLQVFDYMDHDDLYDLEEYAGKLNSLMLIVGSGDITEEEVMEMYEYLDKLGSIIATYTEVYTISKALSELATDMSTHIHEFTQNSSALAPMCRAFSKDLLNWIEQSFHTGAPSIDFMNDTIVVNCQTISGMLKMDEVGADGGDDFDDIFDF